MIRLLRRSRLLAFALLLATPGLGGWLVQGAHQCAVSAPGLPVEQHARGGHDHSTPDRTPASERCTCIGACQLATFGAPPRTVTIATPAALFDLHAFVPTGTLLTPAVASLRLQPPSTAPPVLS